MKVLLATLLVAGSFAWAQTSGSSDKNTEAGSVDCQKCKKNVYSKKLTNLSEQESAKIAKRLLDASKSTPAIPDDTKGVQ